MGIDMGKNDYTLLVSIERLGSIYGCSIASKSATSFDAYVFSNTPGTANNATGVIIHWMAFA